MDLKRVALALHQGSLGTASVFTQEAMRRIQEVDTQEILPYMKDGLSKIRQVLAIEDLDKKAEDTLMYSTIVQNYVLYK